MAEEKSGADSLGLYLTGAASDGGGQIDPDASLGGYRSGTEVEALATRVSNAMPPIIIQRALGESGEGVGVLTADLVGAIAYTPPGGTQGAFVGIADGESKLIEGGDTDKAVRVARSGVDSIVGAMSLTLSQKYTTAIGMSNISSAQRAAGVDTYRAIMMHAHGSYGLNHVKAWIDEIGTQAVSDAGQLGASGTGAITTTGTFADWPDRGWVRIQTAAGVLREIAYYTSRSATMLTVSVAGHRGRLGTSAAAGGGTDTVHAVPGIRLALETPTLAQNIQTIADENTAPTGVTWYTSILQAEAPEVIVIDFGLSHGLWIHREMPAAGNVANRHENSIRFAFKGV